MWSPLHRIVSYGRQAARGAVRYSVDTGDLVRSFSPWWRSTKPAANGPTGDRQPWVTFRAIRALERCIVPGASVFEYGVGGSTLFFLDRGADLISAEHDPAWAGAVSRHVAADATWRLLVHPPDERGGQRDYLSHRLDGSFRQYVTAIDPFNGFDLVFIDGRARASCLRHAWRHVSPGGLLLLDNAERARYQAAISDIDALGWERHDCFGPGPYNLYFWRTTLWRAPSA